MKRSVLLGMLILLLIGCANKMPKEIDVPVAIKQPAPRIPTKPKLPIANLKKDSKPNDVIKAYAASVQLLEGYSDQLINILEAYQ